MKLTHEQREDVQLAILQQLDAVHPIKLTIGTLLIPMRNCGLAGLDEPTLKSLLTDMVSTGLVSTSASSLAAEVKRYERTEAGRVALREAGF